MIFSGFEIIIQSFFRSFIYTSFVLHSFFFIFVLVHFFFGVTQMLHLNTSSSSSVYILTFNIQRTLCAIAALLFALCIIRFRICTDVKIHTLSLEDTFNMTVN